MPGKKQQELNSFLKDFKLAIIKEDADLVVNLYQKIDDKDLASCSNSERLELEHLLNLSIEFLKTQQNNIKLDIANIRKNITYIKSISNNTNYIDKTT